MSHWHVSSLVMLNLDLLCYVYMLNRFLNQCRPKSVSMGNAIKYIKWHINHIPSDMSDVEVSVLLLIENLVNGLTRKEV